MLSVIYNIHYAIKLSTIKYLAQEITAADMRERKESNEDKYSAGLMPLLLLNTFLIQKECNSSSMERESAMTAGSK